MNALNSIGRQERVRMPLQIFGVTAGHYMTTFFDSMIVFCFVAATLASVLVSGASKLLELVRHHSLEYVAAMEGPLIHGLHLTVASPCILIGTPLWFLIARELTTLSL